ncbi:MAG: SDR family oxidoreductase [Anaerolineae bacterium]|nr:SDR family oxidoreductase [Anaerolineae bacterium]MDW8171194.1 SDR family oxidoreductase [Anaerolineae bacterium]
MNTGQPLVGRVALVTGGGGGIGSAICRRLAQAGAHIVITYAHDQAKAEAVRDSLPAGQHLVIQAAVDDSAAQAALAARVAADYGRLDILVNNAGVTRPVPHDDLDALSDELIDTIFRVNVRGALASVRAMKTLLLASGDGLIVNISSVAARIALGSNVAYCASKAALDNLTLSLARALAPTIRVLSVAPGWVEGEYAQRMPPQLIQQQRDLTPLGRIASAEDVAEAVYAAAVHLRFSTGTIIAVDGGRPLR